ncbi:unnamed protein product [Caenorhabditis nigoni]
MPRKPCFGVIPLKIRDRPTEIRGDVELENTQEIDGATWRFGIGYDPYERPWLFVNSEEVSCCTVYVKIVLKTEEMKCPMEIFESDSEIPERFQQFVTSNDRVKEYYNDKTAVLYAMIMILPVRVWGPDGAKFIVGHPFEFSEISLYFKNLFIRYPGANNRPDWRTPRFIEILGGVFHGNEGLHVRYVILHLCLARLFDCPEATERGEEVLINEGTGFFKIHHLKYFARYFQLDNLQKFLDSIAN